MEERTFDQFDEFASDYRSIHTKNIALSGADSLYFAEHKVKQIEKFERDENVRLLDIGCGDGASSFFFQRIFSSWQLEGIDVSEESIGAAKNRNIPSADFQVYNGLNVPFTDNSFDVVFIAAVLHHISFDLHYQLLQEIYRVLKPGGRLYVFEHNPLNPVTRHLVKTCVFDKNAKLLSHAYTLKLLERSGLNVIEKRFILFFPRKGLLSKLIGLEESLGWLPLGGQYFFRAVK